MRPWIQQYALRVIAGQTTGPGAIALRAAMTAAEGPYRLASSTRNRLFDTGVRKAARLQRPVISIGNITTGGTGKTPVIRWLAERLRDRGDSVAVLSRGYKAAAGEHGDEQKMLDGMLNRESKLPVFFRSDASRVRAGTDALREHPDIGVFLLDDGFQHRQLARDFDLVLINAAEPFGYGRVLPRGLLRESLSGLSRASAFLLTRCDQVSEDAKAEIRKTIRQHNSTAPVYESVHAMTSLDNLRGRRFFAFCGLGDPDSFIRSLSASNGAPAGHRVFPDHHDYTEDDLRTLAADAATAGADALVTTEKDWVKLRDLPGSNEFKLPIHRVDVAIRFLGEVEDRLFAKISEILQADNAGTV